MIDAALLDDVKEEVIAHGLDQSVATHLRNRWPEVHFTFCQDDDIVAAQPISTDETFNLYLVVGGEGCISFTSAPEQATGVVIAELFDWEG